ncbi:hypothetical protein BD769DRAFT_1783953 [Suillus cothurnatus]|nr:hypothetical protein BD769DRAFT_1783953 [Suillus cothurnatus]
MDSTASEIIPLTSLSRGKRKRASSESDITSLVIQEVAHDAKLAALLSKAAHPYFRALFETALIGIWKKHCSQKELSSRDYFSDFMKFCSCHKVTSGLTKALDSFHAGRKTQRLGKRKLIEQLRLDLSDSGRIAFLSNIKKVTLTCLPSPYPPKGYWIYTEDAAHDCWEDWILYGHQADGRIPRRHLLQIDFSSLQLVISETESCIIRDAKDSSIVAVIIRNFCNHDEVLSWANSVVCDVVQKKKSIRLEDPGVLAQIGYSAGSRLAPKFDWVKNLQSTALSSEEVDELDFSSSSVFALFWNLCKVLLPQEIIDDFNEFLKANNLCRMDKEANPTSSALGRYVVGVGEGSYYEFNKVEMAPPAGVFGWNYSRATHSESQPHAFALSWTTNRSSQSIGGDFFISSHGIQIKSATNTLVAWRPKGIHGTSLQVRQPDDPNPDFEQTGMSIVTSSRLPSVWKKYKNTISGISQLDFESHGEEIDDLPDI